MKKCGTVLILTVGIWSASAQQAKMPSLTESIAGWGTNLFDTAKYSFFWLTRSASIIPGLWAVHRMPEQRVTFLGSARTSQSDFYAKQAFELARRCAQHNIGIISGGYAGIMQAAATGATLPGRPKPMNYLGIRVLGLGNPRSLSAAQRAVKVGNFEIRQWLMLNFSCTIVAFPGGIGTLYEVAQILALTDVQFMHVNKLILFGKQHWQPLIDWLKLLTQQNLIAPGLLDNTTIVDSAEEAFEHIQQACQKHTYKPFNLAS